MKEVELNKQNFDEFINNPDFTVLVDFYATWCGPCISMKPLLSKIAEENYNILRVGIVNIDSEMELAAYYGVKSVPTFIVFKNGKVFAREVGAQNEARLMQLINEGS